MGLNSLHTTTLLNEIDKNFAYPCELISMAAL